MPSFMICWSFEQTGSLDDGVIVEVGTASDVPGTDEVDGGWGLVGSDEPPVATVDDDASTVLPAPQLAISHAATRVSVIERSARNLGALFVTHRPYNWIARVCRGFG